MSGPEWLIGWTASASRNKLTHAPPGPTLLHQTSTASIQSSTMSNILPLHHSGFPVRQSSLSRSPSSTRAAASSSSSTSTIKAAPQPQQPHYAVPRGQKTAMSGNPSQGPGLRLPSNKKTIYDRNLNRSKNAELSRAAFAYLFIEMIALAQKGAKDVGDLEQRYVITICATTVQAAIYLDISKANTDAKVEYSRLSHRPPSARSSPHPLCEPACQHPAHSNPSSPSIHCANSLQASLWTTCRCLGTVRHRSRPVYAIRQRAHGESVYKSAQRAKQSELRSLCSRYHRGSM